MLRRFVVVAALAAAQTIGTTTAANAIICVGADHLPCLCEVSVKAGPVSAGPFLNC